MMKKVLLIMMSVVMLTSLNSCEDLLNDLIEQSNIEAETVEFNYGDASGVLVAIKLVGKTTILGEEVEADFANAAATFKENATSTSLVDAGSVFLNDKELSKDGSNAYTYTDITNPISLNAIAWSVEGSDAVPAFEASGNPVMPNFNGSANLPESINRGEDLTIALAADLELADSVVVIIGAEGSYLIKRLAASASEVIFTTNELGTLDATSNGMIQVSPFSLASEEIEGKRFYMVNLSSYPVLGIEIE